MSTPVYLLTVRQLLRGKRAIGLALLPLLPAALAAIRLAVKGNTSDADFYAGLMESIFVPTVAALIALIFGASSIGDEREDGTILYLAATPLARVRIVAAKVAGAWTGVLALVAIPLVLCLGLGLDRSLRASSAAWSIAGVGLATLGYCALFAWLSLRMRRAVLTGLLYIVLWEGSIATFAPSARWFSLGAYGRVLVAEGLPASTARNVPSLSAWLAVAILLGVTLAFTLLAGRLLRRVELP